MTQALIAFGANLGDAPATLDEAAGRIADHSEIEVLAIASPLATAAVSGKEGGINDRPDPAPDYLNSAIRIETSLSAQTLFQITRGIEDDMGRQRGQRWGPRTIDLDIILFGDQIIDQSQLQIPHRRMSYRKFVLSPASEIAGDLIDPISGVCLKDLADRLQHSPQAILWIGGDEKAIGDQEKPIFPNSWDFRFVTNIDQVEPPFGDFRLMLFSNPEESFRDAALRFAGPWLDLTGLEQTQCQREIRAAIEAMA